MMNLLLVICTMQPQVERKQGAWYGGRYQEATSGPVSLSVDCEGWNTLSSKVLYSVLVL